MIHGDSDPILAWSAAGALGSASYWTSTRSRDQKSFGARRRPDHAHVYSLADVQYP